MLEVAGPKLSPIQFATEGCMTPFERLDDAGPVAACVDGVTA
jgi:hypothetical protein